MGKPAPQVSAKPVLGLLSPDGWVVRMVHPNRLSKRGDVRDTRKPPETGDGTAPGPRKHHRSATNSAEEVCCSAILAPREIGSGALLGIGDGTFAAARYYGAGDNLSYVAIGDLNGDQAPDLAVANGGSDSVAVLLGVNDVDIDDFALFAGCLGGPGVGVDPECETADIEGDDGDVDPTDFATFQRVFGTSMTPPA